jgi:trigger factor
MNYKTKKQDDATIVFTITVPTDEYQKDTDLAAKRLQSKMSIKGFRKGKAPLEMVIREVGEMAILQEALESIVGKAYVEAIKKEELDIVGRPELQIVKLAPNNDIEFTATVSTLPTISLANIKKLKISKKDSTLDTNRLKETMYALLGMHAEEVEKDGPAEGTDKLTLDMNMTIDNVPVEGGQAKSHQVYLSEDHYIPGFNAHVVGLKKDDTKTFTLDFPENHYQKQLAGKKVDISVSVVRVDERRIPTLTDDFAKKLGQESAAELEALVRSNLQAEADQKSAQSFDIELLDTMIEKSTFSAIPEVLIESEKQKIFYELTRDLDKHGITIAQYLGDLKKTEEELMADFREQAEKRAKAALMSREIAKQQSLAPTKEELAEEIETLKRMYSSDTETLKALEREDVIDTIAVQIQNRKVMEWLREAVSGTPKKTTKKDTKKKNDAHVHGPDCDHNHA